MTVVTVVKGIALVIFAISCVTIYHNTNSYEPSKRVIYIILRKHYNVCFNIDTLCNGCRGIRS
ncbi:MAG: hypothetical protein K2H53_01535 [Clostridia bacterium]|nr:hypothetical protein [Clostridia bacterium]